MGWEYSLFLRPSLSGWLAYMVLARRALTPSELEIAARVPQVGFGIFTAWFGLLFWAGFYSNYYTSLLQPPNEYCCLGYPALPQGKALIPWLMLAAGSLTAVLTALRPRVASLFELASLGLVFTLILAFFSARPFYIRSGGYEYFAGWPLAWWGQSFGTCAGCHFQGGTALLTPFILDWAVLNILVGGLLYIIRLQGAHKLRRDSIHSAARRYFGLSPL